MGEEYSPKGMLRMGVMRGRIMDRMRGGGGGGGGLMDKEGRLSSQRYLQQFKRSGTEVNICNQIML